MKKAIRRVVAVLLIITACILIFIPGEDYYAKTAVGDFEMDGSTAVKYNGTDSNVTLPNTVTRIGKSCFAENNNITKVTIPDSVKEIDFAAFENCKNLEEVYLPDSIKTIGSSAFSGCQSLRKANIPEKTSSIGSAAFAKCNSLSNIDINQNNIYYSVSDGVLYSNDKSTLVQYLAGRPKTTYSMPQKVNKIAEYAFWGAGNLTSCSISGSVKEIPEYAFDNCTGLTDIVLPYGVESLMAFSFADCSSLRNIVLPDTVGYIDKNAFYCSYPSSVGFVDENGNTSDSVSSVNTNGSEDISSESDSSLDASDSNALESDSKGNLVYYNQEPYVSTMTEDFSDYSSPGEIGSTKIVGGNALVMLPGSTAVQKGYDVFDAETEDNVSVSGNITTFSSDKFNIIDGVLVGCNADEENVVIPSGIKAIGDRVFYKKSSLKSVVIPDTVTEIGDFSFARSGLTSVDLPDSITKIGYAAFYQSGDLCEVSVPDSVNTIELGAFDGTKWLENEADAGNDFTIVGDGILLKYNGSDEEVSIPSNIKTIGPQSFYGNNTIKTVNVSDSVKLIGEDAFNNCMNLSTLKLSDSVETIEDRAFKNNSCNVFVIPQSVKTIGLGAFDNSLRHKCESVCFLGDNLPAVSLKPTAGRLSAKNLRALCFEGINNAVISEAAADKLSENNVLSEYEPGFRGQIYVIVDSGSDPGYARLEKVTSIPDINQTVNVESEFSLNGHRYYVTGVKDNAFNSYNSISSWCDKNLSQIKVQGNASNELNQIVYSINVSNINTNKDNTDNKITVNITGNDFPEKIYAAASMEGDEGSYILDIREDESSKDLLANAFYNAYGSAGNIKFLPLSITLKETATNIEIKKLAANKLEITMPMPVSMRSISGVKAATLSRNGALEVIPADITNLNGQESIRFIASHLSPYALFYEINNDEKTVTNVQDNVIISEVNNDIILTNTSAGLAVKVLNKKVGTIETKWFVIIILISLSMILLLWRDKKKNTNK